MSFTIEKNVPIPENRGRQAGSSKYPFAEMEIGDSFFTQTKHNSVYVRARQYAKTHTGYAFAVRKEGEGCRVWRIAPRVSKAAAQSTTDLV